MRSKFKDRINNGEITPSKVPEDTNSGICITENCETKSQSDIRNQQLMMRLASGGKVTVDMKAMKRLTTKNYEKLPEVIKQKEEAKKQQELAAKKAKYAAYQKELDQRLRLKLKKKQEKAMKQQDDNNAMLQLLIQNNKDSASMFD